MAGRSWQQSLRRSTGEVENFRPIVKRRTLQLKSVEEEVFVDENDDGKMKKPAGVVHRRIRLSTRDSVSDINDVEKAKRRTSVARSPSKKGRAVSYLTKFPPPRLTLDVEEVEIPLDLPSPIPLPHGVINIDPEDESTLTYGREVMQYLKIRDSAFRLTPDDIIKDDPLVKDRRERLTEWLINVAHYFKCSQETLYHTINILDRVLSIKKFKQDVYQLVGITSFLLATKLDEYYPADIEKLCYLTENSFSTAEVRAMEMQILCLLEFKMYGQEPMTFLQRFISAAHRSNDIYAYESSILFLDCFVPSVDMWCEDTAKKAASAVLAALILMDQDKKAIQDIWTPNMVYYVWPSYKELLPIVKTMYKLAIRLLRQPDRDSSLIVKYLSESRHHGLLSRSCASLDKIKAALAYAQLL